MNPLLGVLLLFCFLLHVAVAKPVSSEEDSHSNESIEKDSKRATTRHAGITTEMPITTSTVSNKNVEFTTTRLPGEPASSVVPKVDTTTQKATKNFEFESTTMSNFVSTPTHRPNVDKDEIVKQKIDKDESSSSSHEKSSEEVTTKQSTVVSTITTTTAPIERITVTYPEIAEKPAFFCPFRNEPLKHNTTGKYLFCDTENINASCGGNGWPWCVAEEKVYNETYKQQLSAYCCPGFKFAQPITNALKTPIEPATVKQYYQCLADSFNGTIYLDHNGRIQIGENYTTDVKQNWVGACKRWPIYLNCLEKYNVSVSQCSLTDLIHNLLTKVFAVCEQEKFESAVSMLSCLWNSTYRNDTKYEVCDKVFNVSNRFIEYRKYCVGVGYRLECLSPLMKETCTTMTKFSEMTDFLEAYYGNVLSQLFGDQCLNDLTDATVADGNFIDWETLNWQKNTKIIFGAQTRTVQTTNLDRFQFTDTGFLLKTTATTTTTTTTT